MEKLYQSQSIIWEIKNPDGDYMLFNQKLKRLENLWQTYYPNKNPIKFKFESGFKTNLIVVEAHIYNPYELHKEYNLQDIVSKFDYHIKVIETLIHHMIDRVEKIHHLTPFYSDEKNRFDYKELTKEINPLYRPIGQYPKIEKIIKKIQLNQDILDYGKETHVTVMVMNKEKKELCIALRYKEKKEQNLPGAFFLVTTDIKNIELFLNDAKVMDEVISQLMVGFNKKIEKMDFYKEWKNKIELQEKLNNDLSLKLVKPQSKI